MWRLSIPFLTAALLLLQLDGIRGEDFDPSTQTLPNLSVFTLTNLARVNFNYYQSAVSGKVGASCGRAAPPQTPFEWSSGLATAAAAHTSDLVRNKCFGHNDCNCPVNGKCDFATRIRRYYTGSNAIGENVAAGQTSPVDVVDAWLNSVGHCKNIVSPAFNRIGVSYAANTGTQNFGDRSAGMPRGSIVSGVRLGDRFVVVLAGGDTDQPVYVWIGTDSFTMQSMGRGVYELKRPIGDCVPYFFQVGGAAPQLFPRGSTGLLKHNCGAGYFAADRKTPLSSAPAISVAQANDKAQSVGAVGAQPGSTTGASPSTSPVVGSQQNQESASSQVGLKVGASLGAVALVATVVVGLMLFGGKRTAKIGAHWKAFTAKIGSRQANSTAPPLPSKLSDSPEPPKLTPIDTHLSIPELAPPAMNENIRSRRSPVPRVLSVHPTYSLIDYYRDSLYGSAQSDLGLQVPNVTNVESMLAVPMELPPTLAAVDMQAPGSPHSVVIEE